MACIWCVLNRATTTWGAAMTLMLAAGAAAEPVLVQNDSVDNFSQAGIVGGFITGEEGGAWLTSPCDGTIIEVQILWWAGNPGAQPYLANNIWIREAGAFPIPGTVLEQLEAPLLSPFFMNAFVYVDENNTVPLEVPVAAGQTVAITLEFDEPTLPTSGSIVRDVDGCQAGKNVIFDQFTNQWWNACFLGVQGDFVFRMVVDCEEPEGACCLPDGNCTEIDSAGCNGLNGVFEGDNTLCDNVDCPEPPQACCFMPQGCLNLQVDQCIQAEGFPQGPGSNCGNVDCFAVGACCMPDGSCVPDASPSDCADAGGAYQGNDTDCGGLECPQPTGACCLASGGCLALDAVDCAVIPNSAWAGPLTNCFDGDQNGTADACESGCGDPMQDFDQDCDVDLFDYGALYACVSGPGEPAPEACACLDSDEDGDIDLHDFGEFWNNFTGSGPGCP